MRQTCAGTIFPSFKHNLLKWSCDKYNTQRQLVGVYDEFMVRVLDQGLWLRFRVKFLLLGLVVQCLKLGVSL